MLVSAAPAPPSAGLESRDFYKAEGLANDMGLFLQKTNIIRDYLVRAVLSVFAVCCFWCVHALCGGTARRAAGKGGLRTLGRTQYAACLRQ